MFIREVKKRRSKDSKTFYQYNLVQASRVNGKPKQRVILYLGSDSLMRDKESRATVLAILKSKIFRQDELFLPEAPEELKSLALVYYEKYCVKYDQKVENPDGIGENGDTAQTVSIPPDPDEAEYHNTDIKSLKISNVRSYGAENLCTQVLGKLQLSKCFESLGMTGEQTNKALISIAARAIFASSEHKTAQILDMNSELAACFGYEQPITYKQLYAISDLLYEHKSQIDRFLYKRITNMFDIEDKLVIFDISNTYFETRKADSKLAKYGRSKEKRSDCPLVVFTGVINAQGFIKHSRIYEGNTADTSTMEEMIKDLQENAPSSAQQTIVIDAGITTEDNLDLIKEKGYKYVCVARKKMKDYTIEPDKDKVVQLTDRKRSKVELTIFQPEGHTDTWMEVVSEAKSRKEPSMSDKLKQRFEEDLESIRKGIGKKGGTKRIEKVWERIGRIKEKHRRASGKYEVKVEQEEGIATNIEWTEKPDRAQEQKENGLYFIRTNYDDPSEKEIWDIYNTIREVESTFRCLKSDLNIRPVHHQNDERIEAHIYLTILAYQLVNTIRHMLKKDDIRHGWRNILRIMSTQTIQNIEMPTEKKTIHMRKSATPIKEVQQVYTATGCTSTHNSVKKYVVYH